MKHKTKKNAYRIGDRLVVDVTDLTARGEGVAHHNGLTVFVGGALPGERAQLRVDVVKQQYLVGMLEAIQVRTTVRQTPPCDYFPECGGCQWLHLNAAAQAEQKRRRVMGDLVHIGGFTDIADKVCATVSADPAVHYRNKAQFKISEEGIGFYAKGSHQVIPIAHCLNQMTPNDDLILILNQWVKDSQIPIYREDSGTGNLRGILVRANRRGDIMVTLIAKTLSGVNTERLARRLQENLSELVSFSININPNRGNRVLGEETRVIFGAPTISETLCGREFQISPASFFQVNTEQAEKLYQQVIHYANLIGQESVFDLYCGTGTIGICMADRARKVTGIEVVPEAIADAKENARRNNIDNIQFFCGRSEKIMPERLAAGDAADVVVVDPPRKGCARSLLETIVASGVPKIVYVSCNPSTLARDCRCLADAGYRLEEVTPFDLFPGTGHVETVALLSKFDVDKHIDVEIKLDELDLTSAESKATYAQIKEYKKNLV
ncbi:23S rRNA (uracil(1939)-C(5))-methyltransferase RlmD [Pseudoramibacter alactolyticus]|uniref:23S rRNA (uracil(1939)-C(5))-methyltransferase RlmD n=1 Tax=Pseudoramibacter alactolyticus TaxID=113287 RepID=UPI0028E1F460|nr:23S rRNA (uracil(1939)-C(5))-methyltransferase RlmD [Pseudoramibacter alactolyticus]